MTLDVPFTDVQQVDLGSFTAIEFRLHGLYYYVPLNEAQGKWRALGIHHRLLGHGTHDICPYCKHYMYMAYSCDALSKKTDEIFQELIDHPAVRLYWLYNEVEKSNG